MAPVMNKGEHRVEFMIHAYQACLTGRIVELENPLRSAMLEAVVDDICTAARTLPKDEQAALLRQFQHRMGGGH